MNTEEQTEILDFNDIPELELQNKFQQLQIESCLIKTKLESLELENKTLKEENESQQEKIKNFTEYVESLQEEEDKIEHFKQEIIDKDNELQRLNEFITEELLNSDTAQKDYEIEITKLKEDLVNAEAEIEQAKMELTKSREDSRMAEDIFYNDMVALREEKTSLEQVYSKRLEKMQQEAKVLKEQIDELHHKERDLIESNTKNMTEVIAKYTNDIKSLQQNQQNASKNFDELKETKARVFQLEHEKDLLKAEIGSKQTMLTEQLSITQQLSEMIRKLNAQNEELEGKLDKIKSSMLNELALSNTASTLENNHKDIEGDKGGVAEMRRQYEEMKMEIQKYKALESVVKANTSNSLMYRSEIGKLKSEVAEYKKKFQGLLEMKQQHEQSQQMRMSTIAERRTVRPIDVVNYKDKMEQGQGQGISINKPTAAATAVGIAGVKPTIKGNPTSVNIEHYLTENKPKTSRVLTNDTPQTNDLMNSISISNTSELQKQIQFLTEQNKSYQKDINTHIKNKEEMLSKITSLQESNSSLETQMITKEREMNKYKVLCNRLKAKSKESTTSTLS